MAQETIQAVRQAEQKAAQIEKEALLQKEAILMEADKNAKILIAAKTKQALDKAEQELFAANQQGKQLLEAARLKAEGEVLMMKEMALRKEEAAITLVITSVIYNK